MRAKDIAARIAAALCLVAFAYSPGGAQDKPSGKELPQKSEVSGITPEVLIRTDIPGVVGKVVLVTRTTYGPGMRIRKHYHTSQIVFSIVSGSIVVQDDQKEPVTLKAGDTLLIKPGTVHAHWNASQTDPLVFTEFVIEDEGQRSAVFVE